MKLKFYSFPRDFAPRRTRKQTSLKTLASISDVTDWVLWTEFETIADVCLLRCSEVLLMIIILWSFNWHGVCLDVLKNMQNKLTTEFLAAI